MNRTELLQIIRNAGIVGAGGAGFPAYKKLDAKVDHVIANGVECEPLLYKDREVMLQETKKLIRGLEIAREITSASKVTIAIKKKNNDVAESLRPLAEKAKMDIFIMENVYPAGDEFILVYDVTGRRIPPGGIPLQVGCLVNNVETLVNIAKAVEGEPVTDKYVTITGAVKEAVTTVVPIGTSFKDCIELAGGFTTAHPAIFTGGVMMGGVETDLSLSVTKTLGALIVLPQEHNLTVRKTAPQKVYNKTGHSTCDQCSFCTELCPRYILGYPIQPHLVMRSLQMTGSEKERLSLWAANCCECNVCSLFACPEKLDPKNICADTKINLRKENKGFTKQELEVVFRDVHPVREGREIPISMLYQRLGIKAYDRKADFVRNDRKVKEVLIPLKNNFGEDASAAVNIGAQVRRGELIGTVPEEKLGTPIHASINGVVSQITATGIQISSIVL
jgi:Na+-translocating ferredoxin:NAD+ oxidoreductase RnfC subunit